MAGAASAIRGGGRRAVYAAVVALLWTAAVFAGPSAHADPAPKRIVSINACTDQLLFALADRSQIAALTTYAVRDDYSIYTDEVRASGIPLIRGGGEEVLKLKPDLVLAGTYTRRATRQLLQRFKLKLELFPPADTVEETKATIRRAAGLFSHPERGEALIAQIDKALEAASTGRGRPVSVLQIQRRGFVAGPETLLGDLLKQLGVANAAQQLGIKSVGRASLEAALKAKADGLLLFDPSQRAADQGAALLLHPALADMYPPDRRLSLPGRLFICAGPALPAAIAALTKSIAGLAPRPSQPR